MPKKLSTPLVAGLLFLCTFALIFLIVKNLSPRSARQTALLEPEKRLPFPRSDSTTLANEPWSLASVRGRVVVLNYFATWCPPCIAEMPDLIALQNEFAPKGLSIIAVSCDTETDASKPLVPLLTDFSNRHRLNFPIVLPTFEHFRELSLQAVPTTFLIDRQGRIAKTIVGRVDPAQLQQDLTRLTAESAELPPPATTTTAPH